MGPDKRESGHSSNSCRAIAIRSVTGKDDIINRPYTYSSCPVKIIASTMDDQQFVAASTIVFR